MDWYKVTVRGPHQEPDRPFFLPGKGSTIQALRSSIENTSKCVNVKIRLLGGLAYFKDSDLVSECTKGDDSKILVAELPSSFADNSENTIERGDEQLTQLKSRGFVTLATAFHEMYTSSLFTDLQIIIRDRDDDCKEHVILAHRFVLDAFAPAFLEQLQTSPLAIEGSKESNNNNNTENNNNKNTNTTSIQKVYYDQHSAKIVKLFLEFVYTLSIKSFAGVSHDEMIEYKSMQTMYTSDFKSSEERIHLIEAQINNPKYSDVTFLLDDNAKVYAHKAMLSFMCDVFRAMFDVNMGLVESRSSEIPLPNVATDALMNILRYIYTADLWINVPLAVEVLMLSDQYCLRSLKYAAQVEIRNAISVENVCDFAALGHQTNSTFLVNGCVVFIADYLNDVVASEGFQTLDSSIIEKVAARIVSKISSNYDPAIFITEILSTIQQMKGTIAVEQCSRLLTDLCARIGKSKEQDQIYTSNVRSDLLKDKFQKLRMPFDEIKHKSYLESQEYINPKSKRSPHKNKNINPPSVASLMAKQLEVDINIVMKNLVFWWKNSETKQRYYVTVLTCGDTRIDTEKLDKHLKLDKHSKSCLADAGSVFNITGASALMKRIPPFGFRNNIKTIVEKNVLGLDHIYVPTGKAETTWRMSPASLVSMLDRLGIEHEIVELL